MNGQVLGDPRPLKETVLGDVRLVRWPAEAHLRDRYHGERLPRILMVESDTPPPVCFDPYEDWVRQPVSRADFEARVLALRSRVDDQARPTLDSFGVLSYKGRTITVSATQRELLDEFVTRFGGVVPRSHLEYRLEHSQRQSTRNSLDLHIMRLRRRIRPLNLVIDTAWKQGYVLNAVATTKHTPPPRRDCP